MPAESAEPREWEGDLERFRHYLHLVARLHVEPELQGRIDLSGVVQQTLLEAHVAIDRYKDRGDAGKLAWFRKILGNNLADEIRKVFAAARDVGREQSLSVALDESSRRLENWLASEQTSPSECAVRHEQLLRLADALDQLPGDQRMAVELHHLKGLKVADVAACMGRSRGAVGQLLVRGLKRLRELLDAGRTD